MNNENPRSTGVIAKQGTVAYDLKDLSSAKDG
jgi:hypothetical protein